MNSSTASRLAAAIMIWALLMAAGVILTDMISPALEEWVTVILLFFTAAGIALATFTWNGRRQPNISHQETSSEALKRDRLTRALRNLSDDELVGLRKRISSGNIDDDELAQLFDDSEVGQLNSHR